MVIMQSGNLRPPGSTFLSPIRRKVSVWTGAHFSVRRPPCRCCPQRCDFPNETGQTCPRKTSQIRHQRVHLLGSDGASEDVFLYFQLFPLGGATAGSIWTEPPHPRVHLLHVLFPIYKSSHQRCLRRTAPSPPRTIGTTDPGSAGIPCHRVTGAEELLLMTAGPHVMVMMAFTALREPSRAGRRHSVTSSSRLL